MTDHTMRDAPPRAGAMVEALRGLGYSAATAIADIIDNSIAAQAGSVDITFHWKADASFITVIDDGTGMNDAQLEKAMRLGDRNPLERRTESDLGRFGLGLKTASFSQCRRLTVASKSEGAVCVLRWDLDVLAADPQGRWALLEGPDPSSVDHIAPVNALKSGTLVLWEVMDRIVAAGCKEKDFLDLIDEVEKHLAMVFHRFLEKRSLRIRINGKVVAPWNPFLSNRSDTWRSGQDKRTFRGNTIAVEGYVLPHKDRLTSQELIAAEGPDGWTAQQGFYVYRNERMLVAGSWLGLGRGKAWTKEEPFRLARIRLDLPNTGDDDWKIDIRKSRARPPAEARQFLYLFAEDVRQRARKVFAFRGSPQGTAEKASVAQAWRADHLKKGIRYRIDRTHPAIASVIDEAGDMRASIETMLRVIEETVPVQQIWLDTAENNDTPPRAGLSDVPEDEVRRMMQILFENFVRKKGFSVEAAKRHLLMTEPFNQFVSLVDKLELSPEDNI